MEKESISWKENYLKAISNKDEDQELVRVHYQMVLLSKEITWMIWSMENSKVPQLTE